MRERPILFSGDMVRAILDGRKTQTRRVLKPQPQESVSEDCVKGTRTSMGWPWAYPGGQGAMIPVGEFSVDPLPFCPYGVRGDRLWARETFCIEDNCETGYECSPPFTDGRPVNWLDDENIGGGHWQQCHYRATDPIPELDIGEPDPGVRWRPSTNMPRWASRILLEVTSVETNQANEDGVDDGGKRYAKGDWLWCLTFRRCER